MEAAFEITVDEQIYSVIPGVNNDGTYLIRDSGGVLTGSRQMKTNIGWK